MSWSSENVSGGWWVKLYGDEGVEGVVVVVVVVDGEVEVEVEEGMMGGKVGMGALEALASAMAASWASMRW